MDCPRCSSPIRRNERNCPTCGNDVGYPNVRAAKELEEKAALAKRYKTALERAASRGCTATLLDFLNALTQSVAVICRSYSKVKELVSSDSELYASFCQLIGAGARRPEGVKMDMQRRIADAIMFPYYEGEIRFAALSMDGIGATSYGDCSIVLKEMAISERATVFEENSVLFCEEQGLGVAELLPSGYRATWEDRGLLATAKLEPKFFPTMSATEYPAILLEKSGRNFIEVHVYGPLNRNSIERIVVLAPKTEPDRILLEEIKRHSEVQILR